MEPLPLVVAGAGAVGTALGRALAASGWPVASVLCRTDARAGARAALVGAGRPGVLDAWRPHAACLVLLAVPDRQIAPCAERLGALAWPPGCAALHVSGAVPVAALGPLAAHGVSIGGLHPLKSFVDPARDAATLAGTVCGLSAEGLARAQALLLCERLGARVQELDEQGRVLWHAAASHAANHLVALLDQAVAIMGAAGVPPDRARAALLPLQSSTLGNLAEHSCADALTGPIVRGDVEVVRRHVESLAGCPSDVRLAYHALGRRAAALARARGLDEETIARLLAALDGLLEIDR